MGTWALVALPSRQASAGSLRVRCRARAAMRLSDAIVLKNCDRGRAQTPIGALALIVLYSLSL